MVADTRTIWNQTVKPVENTESMGNDKRLLKDFHTSNPLYI